MSFNLSKSLLSVLMTTFVDLWIWSSPAHSGILQSLSPCQCAHSVVSVMPASGLMRLTWQWSWCVTEALSSCPPLEAMDSTVAHTIISHTKASASVFPSITITSLARSHRVCFTITIIQQSL